MRTRFTLAATAALLIAAGAVSASTSGSESGEAARFTYEGYVGGVKIGTAIADVAFGRERYAAKLDLETGGLVGFFYKWRNGSEAYGAAAPAGDAPLSLAFYRNGSRWKGEDRFVEVAAENGVAEIVRATPHPVRDEGRPAVAPALLKNVLDPISALAAIGRVIETTGSCKASFGVFDGRRRYQLKVTDLGEADLDRSRYTPYSGAARKCGFVFEHVAGFKKRKDDDDREPTQGKAYYRRAAEGAPVMPVKIIADSSYGSAILHLSRVELLDPELAAALAEQAADKLKDDKTGTAAQ